MFYFYFMIFCFLFPGRPEPVIRWYGKGKELTDQADFEISYSGGRVSLTIPEACGNHFGQYSCLAENFTGTASSNAQLIVKG